MGKSTARAIGSSQDSICFPETKKDPENAHDCACRALLSTAGGLRGRQWVPHETGALPGNQGRAPRSTSQTRLSRRRHTSTTYVPWSPAPDTPGCLEVYTFHPEKQSRVPAPRSLICIVQASYDTPNPQVPPRGFRCARSVSRVMLSLLRQLLDTAAYKKDPITHSPI